MDLEGEQDECLLSLPYDVGEDHEVLGYEYHIVPLLILGDLVRCEVGPHDRSVRGHEFEYRSLPEDVRVIVEHAYPMLLLHRKVVSDVLVIVVRSCPDGFLYIEYRIGDLFIHLVCIEHTVHGEKIIDDILDEGHCNGIVL